MARGSEAIVGTSPVLEQSIQNDARCGIADPSLQEDLSRAVTPPNWTRTLLWSSPVLAKFTFPEKESRKKYPSLSHELPIYILLPFA